MDNILTAFTDKPLGFNDAIQSVCRKAQVQLPIIHQLRNPFKYMTSKN
ncbi:MAG TPA: hypothetical protein ENH87_09855 [Pricia antarctica]|uniref:Uncharacterized protein n=1 Tax=Pricia antarctica TaxID=641691 RepID=A0A831QQM2_9FLAO|nr:hypothetical protein [Pricia antarctica]